MRRSLLVSACALLLFSSQAPAQTTFASITGTVKDSSGAVLPNAKITVTHVATNIQTTGAPNEAGVYTIPQLKEGAYTLVAAAPGFNAFKVDDLILSARDIRRVDIVLAIGSLATQIEVTGGATLVQTETAKISDVKTSDVLKTVPLNARWMWAFLNLSPNFVSGPDGYRFGGSKGNQSNWAIDGTAFNDGDGYSIGAQANYIESFEEVKVDLCNNSAEFGAVGQLTVVTKSGTNNVHGAAFDYYSTPFFRARSPFAAARGTGVYHLFGGSLSGPVFLPKIYNGKNKTFFYTSFEGSVGGDSTQILNPTVPLQSWRNGDFSGLGSTLIYDPASGQPFPGNRIPANRINPVTQKIQDRFYPLPNYGDTSRLVSNNYRELKTRPWDIQKYWMVRGDHRFSDKDMIFGRFIFTRGANTPYEGNLPTIGRRIQRRDSRSATMSYTHTFRSNLLNEFRWGMVLNNNPYQGPVRGLEQVKELGLQNLAPNLPDIGGMFKVNWSGIGLEPLSQIDYANPDYRNHGEEFQENLSWFRGRHNIKFGFNFTRAEIDQYDAPSALFGSASFSSRFTSGGVAGQGHPYADFLLGIPDGTSRAFAPVRTDRNRWQTDFFAQDDFKVNSRLTVNFGVRYELHFPWRENSNRVSVFDPGTGSIVVPDGALSLVSPIFPKGYAPIIEAKAAGFRSRSLIAADRNNIVPRLGASYRPWGPNTVFHAGFGVYPDIAPRVPNMGGSPFILNEPDFTNPDKGYIVLPTVFPAAGTGGPASIGLPAAINPDLKIPYTLQYSFSVDHQIRDTGFTARYMSTNTRQGDWSYNYNSPVPDSRPYVDKPRPFPQYPAINYYTNGAGHAYNAFTIEANRRMSKGLYFQSHWTWARDTYDLNSGDAPENPFDRRREFAVARSVPTHRWVTNSFYQLPIGKGRHFLRNMPRWANLFVGGWEYSLIYTAQTGQFLTPQYNGPDTVGIAHTTSRTAPNVTRRPDILRNPNLPKDQRSVTRWFDTGAFAPAKPGQFGTSAKGVIIGPGLNIFNMGLHKNFELTERMRFRWEMTAVNMFNHPNWSNPSLNISQAANVGVISSVGGVYDSTDIRAFRMTLRLEW